MSFDISARLGHPAAQPLTITNAADIPASSGPPLPVPAETPEPVTTSAWWKEALTGTLHMGAGGLASVAGAILGKAACTVAVPALAPVAPYCAAAGAALVSAGADLGIQATSRPMEQINWGRAGVLAAASAATGGLATGVQMLTSNITLGGAQAAIRLAINGASGNVVNAAQIWHAEGSEAAAKAVSDVPSLAMNMAFGEVFHHAGTAVARFANNKLTARRASAVEPPPQRVGNDPATVNTSNGGSTKPVDAEAEHLTRARGALVGLLRRMPNASGDEHPAPAPALEVQAEAPKHLVGPARQLLDAAKLSLPNLETEAKNALLRGVPLSDPDAAARARRAAEQLAKQLHDMAPDPRRSAERATATLREYVAVADGLADSRTLRANVQTAFSNSRQPLAQSIRDLPLSVDLLDRALAESAPMLHGAVDHPLQSRPELRRLMEDLTARVRQHATPESAMQDPLLSRWGRSRIAFLHGGETARAPLADENLFPDQPAALALRLYQVQRDLGALTRQIAQFGDAGLRRCATALSRQAEGPRAWVEEAQRRLEHAKLVRGTAAFMPDAGGPKAPARPSADDPVRRRAELLLALNRADNPGQAEVIRTALEVEGLDLRSGTTPEETRQALNHPALRIALARNRRDTLDELRWKFLDVDPREPFERTMFRIPEHQWKLVDQLVLAHHPVIQGTQLENPIDADPLLSGIVQEMLWRHSRNFDHDKAAYFSHLPPKDQVAIRRWRTEPVPARNRKIDTIPLQGAFPKAYARGGILDPMVTRNGLPGADGMLRPLLVAANEARSPQDIANAIQRIEDTRPLRAKRLSDQEFGRFLPNAANALDAGSSYLDLWADAKQRAGGLRAQSATKTASSASEPESVELLLKLLHAADPSEGRALRSQLRWMGLDVTTFEGAARAVEMLKQDVGPNLLGRGMNVRPQTARQWRFADDRPADHGLDHLSTPREWQDTLQRVRAPAGVSGPSHPIDRVDVDDVLLRAVHEAVWMDDHQLMARHEGALRRLGNRLGSTLGFNGTCFYAYDGAAERFVGLSGSRVLPQFFEGDTLRNPFAPAGTGQSPPTVPNDVFASTEMRDRIRATARERGEQMVRLRNLGLEDAAKALDVKNFFLDTVWIDGATRGLRMR